MFLRIILTLLISADIPLVHSKEEYLGCFQDAAKRMYNFVCVKPGSVQLHLMTKSYCWKCCEENNYIYFGLQYSRECYCGNEHPDTTKYPKIQESSCNMPCVADSSTMCGGSFISSLYKDCTQVLSSHFCAEGNCESKTNVWCKKCTDKLMYKLKTISTTSRVCELKCSASNRWCWPGICADEFASRCKCMAGFVEQSTRCQPTMSPEIDSCQVIAMGVNSSGEALSNMGSSSCHLQKDFYGRFQVEYFRVDLDAYFKVVIGNDITDHRPEFVSREKFGVTDVRVIVRKTTVTGVTSEVRTQHILVDSPPVEQFHNIVNISNDEILSDGERLCLHIMVNGGGYLESKNLTNNNLKNVSYDKTEQSKEICYIYDRTPPKHCYEFKNAPCKTKPFTLSTRLTDRREIHVEFDGWDDVTPYTDASLGSGINEYEISIYEVERSNNVLARNKDARGRLKTNQTSASILLPGKLFPMLYAILLEVTDNAKNVRHARRFVLFDNSSAIQTNADNPIRVISASSKTAFQWQISHDPLCFSWKQHFYNDLYNKQFNPLLPIRRDNYDINDEYEQTRGLLLVNGTLNNDGVTSVGYVLKKGSKVVLEGRIDNVTLESTCLSINMDDGDTFEFALKVSDIMNHTINDSVKVNIDRSVPEITDTWIVRDGYEEIYVHHSDDLSKMSLKFKVFDVHSGIREVKWAFGVYENHTTLIEEVIGVTNVNDSTYCSKHFSPDCYCPRIGSCSLKTYEANLTKIKSRIGNHNRRYFFTIDVMNHAHLTSVQHVDIRVDTSPPETGVVVEGPVDSQDIDYTRSNHIIIHWHGFVDHESGIKFYRIALARECLHDLDRLKPGIYNSSLIIETVQTFTPLSFPDGEGQYYSTVIAYNNAMSPSRIACSDGILLDNTTPTISNIKLRYAQVSESIGCFDGEAWLINHDVTKSKLESAECNDVCKNKSNDQILDAIPGTVNASNFFFLCKRFLSYKNNTIYIPSDLLHISWHISEDLSQIAHVFIGFGTQTSDSNSPDIQDYTLIPSLANYIQRHPGLIGERQFYVFIKVVNRAGLLCASF